MAYQVKVLLAKGKISTRYLSQSLDFAEFGRDLDLMPTSWSDNTSPSLIFSNPFYQPGHDSGNVVIPSHNWTDKTVENIFESTILYTKEGATEKILVKGRLR